MVDQVEFADVILLNKCDVLNKAGVSGQKELEAVDAAVKKLNPNAKVIRTEHGNAPLNELLNTKRFDMAKAEQSAGWL